jgi:hypothetical protein
MVPLPLAPAPTTYRPARSLVACDAGTFTRMMASQVAVPRRGACAQADLPTAYRTVPAAGEMGAACEVRVVAAVVVAAVAVAAVSAVPATAAAAAATVSQ